MEKEKVIMIKEKQNCKMIFYYNKILNYFYIIKRNSQKVSEKGVIDLFSDIGIENKVVEWTRLLEKKEDFDHLASYLSEEFISSKRKILDSELFYFFIRSVI